MDTRAAIDTAKAYLNEVYAGEGITDLSVEVIESALAVGDWRVTIGFSRPWAAPRSRAQEVLENLGAMSPIRRSVKTIRMADDGTVLSMTDPPRVDAAG